MLYSIALLAVAVAIGAHFGPRSSLGGPAAEEGRGQGALHDLPHREYGKCVVRADAAVAK